jgi:DNA-binding HxlR family transcriptional regulator
MTDMPRQSPTLARALDDPCSIFRSLGVLSDSWSFLIIREALLGTRTFGQLRERLGIASDVLSARLSMLVEQRVLDKVPYREPGQRTRDAYDLTPAGEDLKTVMVALQQWGVAHVPRAQGPRFHAVTTDTGEPVRACLVDARGRIVSDADVAFVRRDASPTPDLPA